MQKTITLMLATALTAAAQRGRNYVSDLTQLPPIALDCKQKANTCIEALDVNIDPQLIMGMFGYPYNLSPYYDEFPDINERDITMRCVRNMIAFDVRQAGKGAAPITTNQAQIDQLVQAEAQDQWIPYPNFDIDSTTDQYLEQSAIWKKQRIWQKVLEDDTAMPFIGGRDAAGLFTQDMNLTFDHMGDQMPEGREKLAHSEGVVMKVAFLPADDTKYTGMFKEVQQGIMRISDKKNANPAAGEQFSSPSMAVKLLRDGHHSADLVSMFSNDGQDSFNFFKNRLSTHLPIGDNQCFKKTIGKKLAEVTEHVTTMSVMDWGVYNQDGTEEEEPVWPFRLDFVGKNNYGWTDEYQQNYKDQFKQIPVGSILFDIYAYESPTHALAEPKGEYIGKLVSTSEVVTSLWGDQKLFFKHGRIEDDLEEMPQWEDYLQPWALGTLEETGLGMPPPKPSCPFYFLYEQLFQ